MNYEGMISTLVSLGLSTGEAKSYISLVINGPSEATPLAANAGVPQPKVYEYLRSLVSKNFVDEFQVSRAKTYRAKEYEVVLDELQEQMLHRIEATRSYISENKTTNDTTIDDSIIIHTGEKAFNLALSDIFSKAKKSIHCLINPVFKTEIENLALRFPEVKVVYLNDMLRKLVSFLLNEEKLGKLLQSQELMQANAPSVLIVDLEGNTSALTVIFTPPTEPDNQMLLEFRNESIRQFQAKFLQTISLIISQL